LHYVVAVVALLAVAVGGDVGVILDFLRAIPGRYVAERMVWGVVGGCLLWLLIAFAIMVNQALRLARDVFWEEWYPWYYTLAISWCSVVIPTPMKEKFRTIKIDAVRKYGSAHSHPIAGGRRSVADLALTNLIIETGYTPYSISMSTSDARNNILGTRCFFHEKDLLLTARYDELPDNAAIKLVDVDYYLSMPLLMRTGKPIVMYTMVPMEAGATGGDVAYSIGADDVVRTQVQGGADYSHKIWDYERSVVSAHTWWGSWVYAVEQIVVPDDFHRRLVMLVPVRRIYGPLAWIAPYAGLYRRKFQLEGLIATRFFRSEGTKGLIEYFSFAEPGSTFSAIVPTKIAVNLAHRLRATDMKTPYATVEAILRESAKDYPWWQARCGPCDAPTINIALRAVPSLLDCGLKAITHPDAYHYTAVEPKFLWHETKDCMRNVLATGQTPWSQSAYVPTRSAANDAAFVRHRIEKVANTVQPPPKYKMYIREFVERMMPNERCGYGAPVTYEEVMYRQSRPTQMAIISRVIGWMFAAKEAVAKPYRSFMKAEPGALPRAITTIDGRDKIEYSRFMYAMSDELASKPWYAFSKTPRQLSEAVVKLCRPARLVCQTDFSKFDGTHSEFLCTLEEAILRRWFATTYHDEVLALYRKQYCARGVTTHGVSYDTGYSRLSGSAETSCFNSIDNAFVAYVTLRETKYTRLGQADHAYAALGLYGGDDGLTCDVSVDRYARVAANLGLSLKPIASERGQRVKFLSRYFANPWTGDLGSYTDVARQVPKLHLTTAGPEVDARSVLYRKAVGFALTDGETPFIGPWARRVIRAYAAQKGARVPGDERWFEHYDATQQFSACENGSAVYEDVARDLGTDVGALIDVEKRLESESEVYLFPAQPVFNIPQAVKIEMIVGHGVRAPDGGGNGRSARLPTA